MVEEIAAHGDSCAVGFHLLRAMVDTNTCICDNTFVIVWNVFVADENNGAGALADSGHVLSKTPDFICVGFAP